MNENIAEEVQKLALGAMVYLYTIDLSDMGGPILYYTTTTVDGTAMPSITYGGIDYDPFPIGAEGFSWTSTTAPSMPTLTISNLDHAMTNYVLQYNNLIGGKFTRIRTFERFLDFGDDPDSDAHFPPDVYRFERKVIHNDEMIQWELSSWIDQQGVMLPKRMVIRDYCSLRYRNGSSGSFDYSKATCPYTGSNKFKRDNTSTANVNEDVCSHSIAGCRLRFGDDPLPFGGFPGVAKFRV